ncbi:MAG: hypothetical protein NTZ17_21675 [Phycisphaerae bacterium]|nr:hypothetical protein [Phycisphaerae bacterium]
MANYMIDRFDDIDPVKCPCGFARRAFAQPDNSTATVHIVDIQQDSKVHYHKDHPARPSAATKRWAHTKAQSHKEEIISGYSILRDLRGFV